MAKNFHGASKKNRSPRMVGDLEVRQQDQPHGENGVRFSLGEVAKAIAKGRLHPMVRSWTMKTLAKRGNPKGGLARAKAILEELRTLEGFPKASRWAPDPTASEYIAGAHLTLGDGDKPPLFALGDCDDLTVAFGSAVLAPVMYLAAAEAVGVNAAVVGHAYGKDKMIEHVLGAVYDQGRWWYADPSVKDLPFGECKPFTRERVYLVPSMELLCDADVCLTDRGPAAGPPPPPRRGDFVSVNAAPGQDEPDSPSWLTEAPSTLLGFCDLSGCCGVDDDIASRVARAHRAMRETRPTVDASQRELDQHHDDALDPFLPAIPSALNPLNVPTDPMPIRPMWPTTPQPTLDLRTNTLQPAPTRQQMLDARAQQAYQNAQDARAQADAAQADARAHAAQQRTLGDAASDAHDSMRQTIDAAAAQQQQQCFEIATANASEAHQAADIKANELMNLSCFQAWADAPCPDNPLAWNIINVPPQTDYAAQELYQPWHDGLEPYSGASWEIKDSAFLQPRKDV